MEKTSYKDNLFSHIFRDRSVVIIPWTVTIPFLRQTLLNDTQHNCRSSTPSGPVHDLCHVRFLYKDLFVVKELIHAIIRSMFDG